MAFPNLLPRPDLQEAGGVSELWCENVGVPDNGNNAIGLPFVAQGVRPEIIDEDWLEIVIQPLGPSIAGAAFVSLSLDKLTLTLSFAQGGADQARVTVRLVHSIER